MSDILLVESDGGIVRLTLNRPEKRNALLLELLTLLEQAIGRIAADRDARVVVLESRGRYFAPAMIWRKWLDGPSVNTASYLSCVRE